MQRNNSNICIKFKGVLKEVIQTAVSYQALDFFNVVDETLNA